METMVIFSANLSKSIETCQQFNRYCDHLAALTWLKGSMWPFFRNHNEM